MTMVERVAIGIYARMRKSVEEMPPWEEAHEHWREQARETARAAIEALREPSEAMLTGLYDDPIWEYKDSYLGKQQVIDMWKHMIDAALSESTPTPANGDAA